MSHGYMAQRVFLVQRVPDSAHAQKKLAAQVLYPGTYGNYCGPTPEIDRASCTAHGRFGDDPVDIVDAQCRVHDLGYCNCEKDWRGRLGDRAGSATGLSAVSFAHAYNPTRTHACTRVHTHARTNTHPPTHKLIHTHPNSRAHS